uniref:At1g61320/AtMIF1 LRR domain-containing protein n=1 Tax=Arundo donax TaxID=35708 RepID=A0A0A9A515_ARUDO
MDREGVVKARRTVLAIQRYIKPKTPSTVELNVLEPCSRCHAA